jgi:hypothetical protein
MMQWSKIKQTAENLLAASLKGRIQYHITSYGFDSDYSRAWITLDGSELVIFSSTAYIHQYYDLAHQIQDINRATDFRHPKQKEDYYQAYDQAHDIMNQSGIFPSSALSFALKEYLELSIEESLSTEYIVVRAIAMFDRRLGKRRLRRMSTKIEIEHTLVKKFFEVRCNAEGIIDQNSKANS